MNNEPWTFNVPCEHRGAHVADVDCNCPNRTELVPVHTCATEYKFCTPYSMGTGDRGWQAVLEITQRPKACSMCPVQQANIIALRKARRAKG